MAQKMGRDLIRLLWSVSAIPDFEKIWREVLAAPGSHGMTNLEATYRAPSDRDIVARGITNEMERNLKFLMERVRTVHSLL
jgi:hypothetical protein